MIVHVREGCKCKGGRLHAAASSSASVSSCKSFYLHEIHIVSCSKYFRTLLETSVGGLETEMSTEGRTRTLTILHDYIEEGEMEAVEFVLKSFYAIDVPFTADLIPSETDAKVSLLLKALMVAERYQADRCKEKIAEVLSSIYEFTYEAAKGSIQLPTYILNLPLLPEFQSRATHFLYTLFTDLPKVCCDLVSSDNFVSLPYFFVHEWIKRDDLKVHSENDVVYLLDKWVIMNEPSPDQVDALIKEIRVINLGPAYLHQILPNLNWFKTSELSKDLSLVLVARDSCIFDIKSQITSPSWFSTARTPPGHASVPMPTTFTLELQEGKLQSLYEGGQVFSSSHYVNGHLVEGFAEAKETQGLFTLGIGLNILPTRCSCHVPLACTISIDKAGDSPERRRFCAWILMSGQGCGLKDFLKCSRPSMMELIAPWLTDGLTRTAKLKINYDLSEIDEEPRACQSQVIPSSPPPLPKNANQNPGFWDQALSLTNGFWSSWGFT